MPRLTEQYDFYGKHVLVTGASGGLGSAIVHILAQKSARLVVTSRSIKALNELIDHLPDHTDVLPLAADLAVAGEAEALARRAIEQFGHIDALFNIAGVGYFSLMEEATEDSLRNLFEVNTFSPLMIVRTLLPQMKQRSQGRIINIVSSAGRVPIASVGVYGGSKSALAIMANTMRLELQTSGVDIINIYPGTVDTSFEENALREHSRPGLCPTDHCGKPRFDIAQKIIAASTGPPGEIWLEKQGKWFSIAALIWPHYIDRRLSSVRDRVINGKSAKKRRWRLLQLESSLACNLRCIMCPWREFTSAKGKQGIMAPAVWNAIRPHLPQIASIDFTGGGEPLLQPRLVQWVAEAHAAGCETGILTNGLLLDQTKSQQLVDVGIDWICISMDGATAELYEKIRQGSNFEQVCRNLERINRMRSGKKPKTMINFVLMEINSHQMEDIVRLAHSLGADQVNFKQCDVIRGELGKGLGLFKSKATKTVRHMEKTLNKACKLAKKLNLHTTSFAFTPKQLPVCDQDPRNSIFVRHDGVTAPCINLAMGGSTSFLGQEVVMPSVSYGSLPYQDLLELWQTKTCRFYRQRFERRIKEHEAVYLNGFVSGSGNLEKLEQSANAAMAEAPEGCRVCHYLYNI